MDQVSRKSSIDKSLKLDPTYLIENEHFLLAAGFVHKSKVNIVLSQNLAKLRTLIINVILIHQRKINLVDQ